MKYVVIGTGEVGSIIAKDLAISEGTTQVCVGDINFAAAEKLAAEIGPLAKAVKVDIYDEEGLCNTIDGFDVVVNAVGPFYKTARYILEACLKKKLNYVDIADDSSAIIQLLEYEDRCKEAGITALISQGVSPGTTNMLGLLGSQKLDEVDEIHTSWVESALGDIGLACIWHGLEMSTGIIPQFLNGKMTDVTAATGSANIKFRKPLGEYPVHYVGHGEPVTMPRYIKANTITNRGNVWPIDHDITNYKVYEKLGLASNDILRVGDVEVVRRDITAALIIEKLGTVEAPTKDVEDPLFQVHVSVSGKKDNKDVTYVYTCFTDMNPATALSASYGAQVIAKGKLTQKGLFPPEGILDTKDFFLHLEKKGFEIYEEVIVDGIPQPEMLLEV